MKIQRTCNTQLSYFVQLEPYKTTLIQTYGNFSHPDAIEEREYKIYIKLALALADKAQAIIMDM